jgi:hypothetical protein
MNDSLSHYQNLVHTWTKAAFGEKIAHDKLERNHRFLEEALELVQSAGCTKEEALQLVDYVYSREIGALNQEIGGVMTTLCALANARDIDVQHCAEVELLRCWSNIDRIRAKQAAKPKHSPLP